MGQTAGCSVYGERSSFVHEVFAELLQQGQLKLSDDLLVVAGGRAERDLLEKCGFDNVTITNLDSVEVSSHLEPYQWAHEDAQNLSYQNKSFRWVIVVDGLHHCTSPHRALTEMYRVCINGVIAIEARDSLLMRAAVRFGFSSKYELEAVVAQGGRSGGLENGPIPNYIYRWTEREFKKTIRSCDPTGEHGFRFHHGLNMPHETADLRGWHIRKILLKPAGLFLRILTSVMPKQRNSIAMIATRPTAVHPWIDVVPDLGDSIA